MSNITYSKTYVGNLSQYNSTRIDGNDTDIESLQPAVDQNRRDIDWLLLNYDGSGGSGGGESGGGESSGAASQEDLDKLAADVNINTTDIAGLKSDLESLGDIQDFVDTNKADILKNAQAIEANATSIAKNAEDIAGYAESIATNAQNVQANADNIQTNIDNIDKNTQAIDALTKVVSDNTSALTDLEPRVKQNEDDIEALQDALNTANETLGNVGNTASKNAEDIANLKTTVDDLGDVEGLSDKLAQIETNKADIASLKEQVEAIPEVDLSELESKVEANATAAQAAADTATTNAEKIATNLAQIETNKADIASLGTAHNSLVEAVGTVTEAVATNGEAITALSEGVNANGEAIEALKEQIEEGGEVTGDYLPLAGGTLTGGLDLRSATVSTYGDSPYIRLLGTYKGVGRFILGASSSSNIYLSTTLTGSGLDSGSTTLRPDRYNIDLTNASLALTESSFVVNDVDILKSIEDLQNSSDVTVDLEELKSSIQTLSTTVEELETTATQAQTTADSALENASTASNTATTAVENADTAKTNSEEANTLSDEALETAKDAVEEAKNAYFWAIGVGQWINLRQTTLPTGYYVRDGGLIENASTTVPMLVEYLQLEANQDQCITEEEWQDMQAETVTLADGSTISKWDGVGGVPYYVLDLEADTLRLPDTRGMYSEEAGFDGLEVGGAHHDMIRNITGYTTYVLINHNVQTAGPFYTTVNVSTSVQGNYTATYPRTIHFDTSRTTPTGNYNKPRAYGVLGCVYAGTN